MVGVASSYIIYIEKCYSSAIRVSARYMHHCSLSELRGILEHLYNNIIYTPC